MVTPHELRVALLDALSSPVLDRAMWDQDITNASPLELADLVADLTFSRTAPGFRELARRTRQQHNRAPDGADEFDACETEEIDDDPD